MRNYTGKLRQKINLLIPIPNSFDLDKGPLHRVWAGVSLEHEHFAHGTEINKLITVALLAHLEAKPGKETEVENFLNSGLALVAEEPQTIIWFAVRSGPLTFDIFDVFTDEAGRQAHLSGKVAFALKEKASELLSQPPEIKLVDVQSAQLPGYFDFSEN